MKTCQKIQKGFTLIELLVVIAIIGILSTILITSVRDAIENARYARAKAELRSIHAALELYMNDHNGDVPDDVHRSVPPGLEEYLAPGNWVDGPWPLSVYDWDNWNDPDNPGKKIWQISLRFCTDLTTCNFPKTRWAENFNFYSAMYYCVKGSCRSHQGLPVTHPGHCINCY